MQQRRSQAARSQAAREQIAQAALTVFALKGYGASSMDDICLAAGCSKGGLYHHYRTKGAVLAGVVERLAARDALMPPFADSAELPAPAIGRVLIEVWAEAARDAALRDQLRSAYLKLAEGTHPNHSLETTLRLGTLIQELTLGNGTAAADLAHRLGIERAA